MQELLAGMFRRCRVVLIG